MNLESHSVRHVKLLGTEPKSYPIPAKDVDRLASLLSSSDDRIKEAAAATLAHAGTRAKRAVPAIQEAFHQQMLKEGNSIIVPSTGLAATLAIALDSVRGDIQIEAK